MALNQDGDTIINITSEGNDSIMLATAGTYADRNIIFNVYKNSGIDTSDATATENDVANGKTAYVNGQKITGNLPEITSGFGVQCTSSTIYDQSQTSQATINFGYKNATKRIFYKDVILTLNVAASEFGNATAADVASGKTFTSSAGLKVTGTYTPPASANIQSNKTVTPTKSVQTVNPDSGYSALAKVTVSAIPSNYIIPSGTLTISKNGTKDVTNYANVTVNVASSGSTVADGQITLNTTLPTGGWWGGTSATSSGTINRGQYIKIGAGKYDNDLYYLAQANSGTKSITENGTNISVDGYQYVTVNVASSSGSTKTWPTSASSTASNTTGQTAITPTSAAQYINLEAGTYSSNKTYKINAISSSGVTAPARFTKSISSGSTVVFSVPNANKIGGVIAWCPTQSSASAYNGHPVEWFYNTVGSSISWTYTWDALEDGHQAQSSKGNCITINTTGNTVTLTCPSGYTLLTGQYTAIVWYKS